MKNSFVLLFLILSASVHAQNKTLNHVPDSCSYVINFDLKRITSNISLEEADGFQFIKTITENYLQLDPKTVSLKNIGVDYLGHAAFFSGGTKLNNFTGTIIPIKDETLFIKQTVSDNVIRQALLKTGSFVKGQQVYLVHDGFFIATTVSATEQLAFGVTDSLFDANGWEKPFSWDSWMEEDITWDEVELLDATEEIMEENSFDLDEFIEEDAAVNESPVDVSEEELEFTDEEFTERFDYFSDDSRYYEIKDSILAILSEQQAQLFSVHLKSTTKKLIQSNKYFKQSMNRASDVTIFISSASIGSTNAYPYSLRRNPFFVELESYLQNTWQAGYLNFTSTGMTVDWLNHTGEKMTKVVSAMSKSKFDKKLLHYIPANSNAFVVINMNTKAAYDEAKKIYLPMLDQSKDPDMILASAIWSLLDEIIKEEALFDIYFSKAFVSFNGIRDMVVQKTTYDYDPETFEPEEREETDIQKIPALTFGLSTSRSYLVTKFMNAMAAQGNGAVKKESDYFKLKYGPIPGVTFYLLVRGDIVILTNEQDLVRNNPNGYGKSALGGLQAKKAEKTKMIYAHMDMDDFPEALKDLVTNPGDKKFIKALSDNSGEMEIAFGEIQKDYYSFKATYTFHGKHKSGIHYLMSVLNLMMSYEDEYYDDF